MKLQLIVAIFLSFCITFTAGAQVQDPVKWTYTIKKEAGNSYSLKFTANIENGWHLYSQDIPNDGPVPTSFTFEKSDNYERIGQVKELTKPEIKFDSVSFMMELKMFSHQAVFIQNINVKTEKAFEVKGEVEFMSCDDNSCLPPKRIKFSFNIPATKLVTVFEENSQQDSAISAKENPKDTSSLQKDTTSIATLDQSTLNPQNTEEKTTFGFIIWAFLWGLAGAITPCVYPMIPMTVSFFMRGEAKRSRGILKGLVFGLSIIAIYTLIGVLVSLSILSSNVGNVLSTHWIPNLVFFLLFVVFAASFFGMFEMVLPGSLINKIDQQAEKGGFSGAFFMALTLVIVSFSCTGPIVGKILIEASRGLAVKPIAGMFGYALAFALPFTFFAIFPSLLKSLPKSGGWLNAVKVVLGFIVLAFSLTFVTAIDQSYHLDLLSRDVFISIWLVLSLLLGLYLLGKIRFAHDSDVPYIGVPRLMLVVVVFSFMFYLFTGLMGSPLKSLSWILPPQENTARASMTSLPVSASTKTLCGTPKHSDLLSMPHQLSGYFDFEEGLACAKQKNKPVLLDFKGHSCKNCKIMEAEVWSDPRVLESLRNDFIIIALYTDEKRTLPENEWITSTLDKEIKKTIGEKNQELQIVKFGTNTLPLYAIVNPDGKPLTKQPMPFNRDVESFLKFLKEGKENFVQRNQ